MHLGFTLVISPLKITLVHALTQKVLPDYIEQDTQIGCKLLKHSKWDYSFVWV